MKEKKLNPVWAIYSIGLVCVISGLIFPIYQLSALLLTAAAACLAYLLVGKFLCAAPKNAETPIKFAKTGVAEADEIIKKGRGFIKKLDEQNALIPDTRLSAQISRLRGVAADIFDFLAKNPENGRQLNNFMDYYFPTTLKLLDSYIDMQNRARTGDGNIAHTLSNIENVMDNIQKAFEKQLDTLYESKNLDISSDIDVLKTILREEGLA